MRKKISHFFNSAARHSQKTVVSIAAGFLMAIGTGSVYPADKPLTSAEIKKISTATFSQTTYWKHPEYNIIAKVEPCKEKGLCISVHNIDNESFNNRLLLARLLGLGKAVDDGFSDILTRYEPDPDQVYPWLVDRYCNYEAEVKLTQNPAQGEWSGSIYSPFNQKSYGISLSMKDTDTVIASGYFLGLSFLKKSIELNRLEAEPSACYEFSGGSYWVNAEEPRPKVATAPKLKKK